MMHNEGVRPFGEPCFSEFSMPPLAGAFPWPRAGIRMAALRWRLHGASGMVLPGLPVLVR
jgi:hypothetical protein